MTSAIPHYRQECRHLCGPASLQMVLARFNIHLSQKFLARLLCTECDLMKGTENESFANALAFTGLRFEAGKERELLNISEALDDDRSVIVNYINPETNNGHFAVVKGMYEDDLVLCDPWNGENYVLGTIEFYRRWRSRDGRHKRWMLTINKKGV